MKYSYMPVKYTSIGSYGEYAGYFDSDDRTLSFRNQYGEHFLFAPVRGVRIAFVSIFTIGIIFGIFLAKVI